MRVYLATASLSPDRPSAPSADSHVRRTCRARRRVAISYIVTFSVRVAASDKCKCKCKCNVCMCGPVGARGILVTMLFLIILLPQLTHDARPNASNRSHISGTPLP